MFRGFRVFRGSAPQAMPNNEIMSQKPRTSGVSTLHPRALLQKKLRDLSELCVSSPSPYQLQTRNYYLSFAKSRG